MRIRTINMYENHHIKREVVIGFFKNKLIPRHKTYTITNDNIPIRDDKSVTYIFKEYDLNGKKLDINI